MRPTLRLDIPQQTRVTFAARSAVPQILLVDLLGERILKSAG